MEFTDTQESQTFLSWFFGDFRKKHQFLFWFLVLTFIVVLIAVIAIIIGILSFIINKIFKKKSDGRMTFGEKVVFGKPSTKKQKLIEIKSI